MKGNHIDTAIILAGGMGTRLAPVLNGVPKPMAPVANRPFLEYVLDFWIGQGVKTFIFSVGYMADSILNHFGEKYRDACISYSIESEPLGTGGALKKTLFEYPDVCEDVIVLNGDTWFEIALTHLTEDYFELKNPIVIALKKIKKNSRYGAIIFDDHYQVTQFADSSCGESFINAGIYILNIKSMVKLMDSFPQKFSLENDFMRVAVKKCMVSASVHDVPFLDIGLPEDYKMAANLICK